jgi:hypothetical protein
MKIDSRKLLGLIVITASLLNSCKKDDQKSSSGNYFQYDVAKYSLSQGLLQYYGSPIDGTYYIDAFLLSSDFTIYSTGTTLDSIKGTGDAMVFEFYSSQESGIPAGTYTYDSESTETPGTFDFAACGAGVNWDSEVGTVYEVNAGTVTVAKTGTTYDITIDCTATTGKKVTGHYKGTLQYSVDIMGKKSGQAGMKKPISAVSLVR